jgi:xyloglucan-specific exo-beta-1,4-glucanase
MSISKGVPMQIKTLFLASCLTIGLLLKAPSAAPEPYKWGNVCFEGGGFVSGIITSKTQPGLVYARTDVGGAYRWDSTGGRWIPLMDFVSQLDVGLLGTEALALDPQDPRRLYILAGTEYFSDGKTMIFRSNDYGQTFDTVNVTSLFKAHGNGMGRQTGEKLAVDPQNSAILFCGSRTKGLFKSSDTGKTWIQVPGTEVTAGNSLVSDIGISFIIFDPSSGKTTEGGTKTIYMGVAKTNGSLYVSNNGGASFTTVAGTPSNMMAMRGALSQGNLYITFSNSPGPHSVNTGSVWKYSTATSQWTNITPKDENSEYYGSGSPGKAHGFGGISIDPADPQHIILTTVNCYSAQYRWSNKKDNAGDIIFVSTDGGATWKNLFPAWITNDGTNANVDANGNNWIDGTAIHWAGSIEFDPFYPKRVWVTSGNGVFRTDDITATSPLWKFQSRGLEETVPLDIVSVPGGPLVTAIGDYDGARYTDIYRSAPAHEPRIGTTVSLGYGPLNGTFVRAGHVTDYSTNPPTESDVLYYSTDTAKTWTQLPTPKVGKGYTVLNADGSVILHRAEVGNTVYRSADKGVTWTTVNGLDGQSSTCRIIPDPVDKNIFYILDQQGWFMVSSDGGANFTKQSRINDDQQGLYQNSTSMMRTVPGKKGHLLIPLDQNQLWQPGGYSRNGLALTEDGGNTFVRFPAVNVCVSVGLGKAAPGKDYYAIYIWGAANNGPIGIYRSIDKGDTWERINDDRHQFGGPGNGNFVVGDFNVYGRVYMSTVGRGLIYGEPEGTSPVKHAAGYLNSTRQIYRTGNMIVSNNTDDIYLVNLSGRIIRKSEVVKGVSRINLSGLNKGIYLATSGSRALKIIVK